MDPTYKDCTHFSNLIPNEEQQTALKSFIDLQADQRQTELRAVGQPAQQNVNVNVVHMRRPTEKERKPGKNLGAAPSRHLTNLC